MKLPVHLGNLSGSAGNAFAIMGAVQSSARQMTRAGIPFDAAPIIQKMQEGDYDHLLDTVLEFCDDLDDSIATLRSGEDTT
jgi:hypothetical protein